MHLTKKIRFLRAYSIPEPVSGGVVAALGLIVASLLGGPIARYLIFKHKPEPLGTPTESYAGAALEEHPRAGGQVSNG